VVFFYNMRIKTPLALALLYLISSSIWLIRIFYFRIHRKEKKIL
jgi:hypothetical protein